MDNSFDSLFYNRGELIAGIDESGVSDIAGPLVAACVILPKNPQDIRIFDVDDSKKIPEKYRKQHAEIVWNCAAGIGIGEVSAAEMDFLGKRKSTILAMVRAVAACQNKNGKGLRPDLLLIDGAIPLPTNIPQECLKDGDAKSLSVAAASVIAKVYRDEVMLALHQQYPWYGWNKNKGHPCENQFRGMDDHGVVAGIHRTRFWPFSPGNEKREDEPAWYARRGHWRQKTLESSLGDAPWITKQPSSKGFAKSKPHPEAKKSEPNGKSS